MDEENTHQILWLNPSQGKTVKTKFFLKGCHDRKKAFLQNYHYYKILNENNIKQMQFDEGMQRIIIKFTT